MNPNVPRPVPAPASVECSGELSQITVSSRIPEFWTDAPRLWFVQFEAVVASQKLGDESKYNLVITKLSKDSIHQVTDLLLQPPAKEKYSVLKDRLLTVYEESELRQVQKLLSEIDLGEQKPSQLLRRMKDLARDKFPDDTLRILWTGHLPSAVRGILTVSEVKDLEKLAEIADKVMESSRPSGTIAEVGTSTSSHSNDLLVAEISRLSKTIENMQRGRQRWRQNYAQRNRSLSKGRRTSSSQRRNPESPDWLCFYHFRFANRAHKCVKPCNWKENKEGQGN